jgi:predicted HicB family RNase H-like nuclease
MTVTCGTCGHQGEDGKDYAHDCYWVFRERGRIASMAKKRGYSNEFPTDHAKRVRLEIDQVPPDLARKVRAKAKREGVSLRTLILRLLTQWLNG